MRLAWRRKDAWMEKPTDLTRYAWLSIAAALVTIGLKTLAWYLTGSVGLLADAAESLVNLFAAIMALVALTVAMKPADKNHHFGHSKAEYFSAAIEGLMIFDCRRVYPYQLDQSVLQPASIRKRWYRPGRLYSSGGSQWRCGDSVDSSRQEASVDHSHRRWHAPHDGRLDLGWWRRWCDTGSTDRVGTT